jgi:hypothetical protein
MRKRTLVACLMVAVSAALTMVATASAVQLTFPTGTKLATGGKLQMTNVGNFFFKGFKPETLQTCSSMISTGTLTHNGPEDITTEITSLTFRGTATAERCTLTTGPTMNVTTSYEEGGKKVGVPYCLTTTAGADKWTMPGGACGGPSRPIKFKIDLYSSEPDPETEIFTLLATCVYEKASLTGSFLTDTGAGQDAQLTFSEEGVFKRTELSNILYFQSCPEETKLIATATMETDTTSAADPLYIS